MTAPFSVTAPELAAKIGGRLEGPADGPPITGVSAIAESGPEHVTFLGNPKYAAKLDACPARAALVPETYRGGFAGARIVVEDPSLAFVEVVKMFLPPPVGYSPGVHPTAVVAPDATLGDAVVIGPHVVIEPGAKVGDRTILGAGTYLGHGASVGADSHIYPRVTIREHCRIGARAIIHSGVVIGSDGFGFSLVEGRHRKIPQVGMVQIDDDVEIGANTTIDRARFGRTWIQEGTKIDNLVQVAHNVVVGKHSLLVAQAAIAGSTTLGNYVTLAGQVGVAGHLHLADRSIVAAQGGVGRDLEEGEVMWGSPALPMRQQKELIIHWKNLGKLFKRVKAIEQSRAEDAGK